jgi:hypothetical protein
MLAPGNGGRKNEPEPTDYDNPLLPPQGENLQAHGCTEIA